MSKSSQEVTSAPAETSGKQWVLGLVSIASFMVALDAMVVTTALGTIRLDLSASMGALEWVVNAYNLSFAVLLLTGAALGDRLGRRRMFMAGLGLFILASAGCALASGIGALIAARALQGAGAALVMPLAMVLLSAAYGPEERGKALGIFSAITGLALIAGPVVGGVIAAGLDWRWIFWLNLPIGLVTLPFARIRIAESHGPNAALDAGGLALMAGAALAAVWGLMHGNSAGWASIEVSSALVIGVALALAFCRFEQRASTPMVPLRLFGTRAFAAGNAAAFCLYASMYGVVFLLPQFLQTAQRNDPLGAGLRLLPWTATLFVFAPLGGALVNRLGERPLVVAGLLLQAFGFAWIAVTARPDLAYLHLAVPLVVAGAGVSLAMPAAQNAVLNAVAPGEIGKASGVFNMLRFLGGVCGVAILAAAFAANGDFDSAAAFSAGFRPAIGCAAALSLAGAGVGLWLPGRHAARLAPAGAKT
jgi:EmrB/QacA subfamily drug resistance transporter